MLTAVLKLYYFSRTPYYASLPETFRHHPAFTRPISVMGAVPKHFFVPESWECEETMQNIFYHLLVPFMVDVQLIFSKDIVV